MPTWTSISFQDSSSPIMEHITYFHDHTMIILILITTSTIYTMYSMVKGKNFNKFITEGQEIETMWTILPAFMLIFIALPSMKTLYLMEDSKSPTLTVKISGHQWYWSYEQSSLNLTETESFMETSLMSRLLKTTEMLSLPINTSIRGLVTSTDVIHSWTIPSLGSKVDAFPGRLNQIYFQSKRLGMLSGQCSEICGMNHSFMPILAQFMKPTEFIKKIK